MAGLVPAIRVFGEISHRILDPKHATKLPGLTAALRALGKRLVVGVMEAA